VVVGDKERIDDLIDELKPDLIIGKIKRKRAKTGIEFLMNNYPVG